MMESEENIRKFDNRKLGSKVPIIKVLRGKPNQESQKVVGLQPTFEEDTKPQIDNKPLSGSERLIAESLLYGKPTAETILAAEKNWQKKKKLRARRKW